MTIPTIPFRHQRLGYIALNVSDVARSAAFAEEIFGVNPAGAGADGERYFRVSSNKFDLALYPSKTPGFKRVSWELENEENVDRAFAYFADIGLKPAWLSDETKAPLGLSRGNAFRLREPHSGACFEYYALIQQTSKPFDAKVCKIARLGHFALNVPDLKAATRFYLDKMNFNASDYVGDLAVSLLRAAPNPLHHTMGLGQSRTGKAHLNHINFMVTDIDDIGRALYRFQKHNVPIQFGPGRHPTSNSIFIYAKDPDGMTWEYSFGMELFPEENPRKPRHMSTDLDEFDLWGAVPSKDFASFGEIEAA